MLGFETIGNATAIFFDGRPILATDPWIAGDAYFGSWTMSHDIPKEQLDHVMSCDYVWLSHGHPDHANAASLDLLRSKQILLPDHVGSRMKNDLVKLGFAVRVLPERTWTQLSPRVRVLCIADYHQDAVLLVDVDGTLVVDLNDAVERGWGRFVKNVIAEFDTSFLLKLFGYGDADMINVFREDGARALPPAPGDSAQARQSWDALFADKVRFWARRFGARYLIPFSMFHAYQRSDSAWANAYTTPESTFASVIVPECEILPAFVRYDCELEALTRLEPRKRTIALREPKDFGDDWAQPLEEDERQRLERYVTSNELLRGRVDRVAFRVGGREHALDLGAGRRTGRAITFDVPRASLMEAVDNEVFDDLLIGNFMKTTLHGDWGSALAPNVLYPHFTPYVTRYADNGRAKIQADLDEYLQAYRRRAPFDYLVHRLEHESVQTLRSYIDPHSRLFRRAIQAYSFLKVRRIAPRAAEPVKVTHPPAEHDRS